jgi:hypothetical protein
MPVGPWGWVFAVAAAVAFVAAVWQFVQIVRWPEGKELMRDLDAQRERSRSEQQSKK